MFPLYSCRGSRRLGLTPTQSWPRTTVLTDWKYPESDLKSTKNTEQLADLGGFDTLGDEGPAEGGDAHTDHGEAAGEVDDVDLVLGSEADDQLLSNYSCHGDQCWSTLYRGLDPTVEPTDGHVVKLEPVGHEGYDEVLGDDAHDPEYPDVQPVGLSVPAELLAEVEIHGGTLPRVQKYLQQEGETSHNLLKTLQLEMTTYQGG